MPGPWCVTGLGSRQVPSPWQGWVKSPFLVSWIGVGLSSSLLCIAGWGPTMPAPGTGSHWIWPIRGLGTAHLICWLKRSSTWNKPYYYTQTIPKVLVSVLIMGSFCFKWKNSTRVIEYPLNAVRVWGFSGMLGVVFILNQSLIQPSTPFPIAPLF